MFSGGDDDDMDVGETIGKGVGVLVAPLAALGSFLRGARLFHAQGVVYRAEVSAAATDGALGALAERLAGPALVRLSWGGPVLGVAVRFGTGPVAVPSPGTRVQDLILISARSLRELPIAARLTEARDFLANDYYTIARYRAAGLGLVELRLVAHEGVGEARSADSAEAPRLLRLERKVAAGSAVLGLEVRQIAPGAPWQPLATITLTARAEIDQEALELDPYHADLGLEPAGFVQGLRWAVYPASHLGRRLRRRLEAWLSRRR
jgi:hypothetical protein